MELLDEESCASGVHRDLTSLYTAFLLFNDDFKGLCTDWQVGEHDPTCIDRLSALHDSMRPVLDGLGDLLERMSRYPRRFDAALERLQAGDVDAFTKPMTDSYHDMWMELHEDLLATLGRSRTSGDGV